MNILLLCTGNSARSILGEAIINRLGEGRFRAFSAGSFPKGAVHPGALRLLARHGYPTDGLRSKSWDEFAAPGAPPIDLVITVCDNAAGEVCPIWPGHPVKVHWGLADPAAVEGDDAAIDTAFEAAHAALSRRVAKLVALPCEDQASVLRQRIQAIHDDLADTESAPAPIGSTSEDDEKPLP
ncbi:arsenate reductase ArsC [Sphingomonas sp. RT2P30]|uniref:arsenate reductase ArsC n=1 Tax=Parasphingomonas halimpatiens TaxID=3096162 RepID=UPI002FC6479C